MQPHRLSYGTAGVASRPRAEPANGPRHAVPARVTAIREAALPYGARSPAQKRQRRLAIATLVLLHGVAIVGLLNTSRLREAATEARPVFLAVVDAPSPATPPRALPPPPTLRVPVLPPLQMPLIAPEPSPSPSPLVAQVVPPPSATPALAAVEAAPVPAPSLPRTLPAAGVQFLVPPAPVYSRISAKMREYGRAVVRVYIDEAGMPREVVLAASSGFARLDDSALAAVRNARFKPYAENGVAVAGWAAIPIEFELHP